MTNIQYMLYLAFALYLLSLVSVMVKRERYVAMFLVPGFIIHTAYVIARGWFAGIFIAGAIFQGAYLLPWAMSLCVMVIWFSGIDNHTESGLVMAIVFTFLCSIYPQGVIAPMPNKITAWSYSFFFTEVCAQACFILGGWFAVKSLRGVREDGLVRILLSWGFVLYTVAQIVGAIWAFLGWGSTFHWGSKHLQSAVIWIYYANYLHLRYIPERTDKQQQWYAIAGSLIVMYCVFSYYSNESLYPKIGG